MKTTWLIGAALAAATLAACTPKPTTLPAAASPAAAPAPAPQPAPAPAPAVATGRFTDITQVSGVDAILDADYQATLERNKTSTDKRPLWLSGINLIDLDGDGKLDLFLSAHNGYAAAALGDGQGHFRAISAVAGLPAEQAPALGGQGNAAIAPGDTIPDSEVHVAYDLNEDGKLDLEMTDGDGGGRWWMNQSTPGHLSFKRTDMIAVGGQARQSAVIDIDRDGKADWLHEGSKSGTTTIDLGDGQGKLTPTRKNIITTTWKDGPGIIPVDVNGDGFIDIIFSKRGYQDEHSGTCRIYLNDGQGNFSDATTQCGLNETGLQIMGVGDFNHDGNVDLICLQDMKQVEVYLGDGKGKFTKLDNAVSGMEAASKPQYSNWGMAVAVDLDNDGNVDVMMNGRPFLYVLKGTGDGHFTYVNKTWGIGDFSDAAVDAGICFGDIDGDGMLDVLGFKGGGGNGNNRRVKVYHNDLPAQNFVNIRPIGLPGNKGAAGAKIRVYEAGHLGDAGKLVSYEQVGIWARQVCPSYYFYPQTERHFGLGQRGTVDVSVEFYPSGKKVEQKGVKAGTTAVIEE